MKKKRILFILIVMLTVFCGLLSACDDGTVTPVDLQTYLTDGITAVIGNEFLSVNGTTSVNGAVTDNFSGIIYNDMKQAKITINDINYYYFGKIRFSGNENGITIVDYMSYASLLDLMGTTLLNYEFDANNISSITQNGDTLLVKFIGIGTQYSFGTSLALYDGTMSVIFKDGIITKTILASSYTINSVVYNYISVTNYSSCAGIWDKTPKVLPSQTTMYANYILNKLATANPSATLHLSTTSYDTTSKLSDLISTESLMSSVFVTSGETMRTITIAYKTSQLVVGISATITEIELCYDDNFVFYYMFVNDNNKYILS